MWCESGGDFLLKYTTQLSYSGNLKKNYCSLILSKSVCSSQFSQSLFHIFFESSQELKTLSVFFSSFGYAKEVNSYVWSHFFFFFPLVCLNLLRRDDAAHL